jgi:hypothetical protein
MQFKLEMSWTWKPFCRHFGFGANRALAEWRYLE